MPKHLTVNVTEKCVMARIKRQTHLHQANFTLKQFGTYAKAKAAAKVWVQEKLAELPGPTLATDRKTSRNTSGVVGVRLANATRRKNGNVYEDWRWVAFWSGCPQSGGVGWSVKKFGEDRAFASAYLARQARSIDRAEIEAAFLKLQNSAEYKRVLKHRRISPP